MTTTAAASDSGSTPDSATHSDAYRSFCDVLDEESDTKVAVPAEQSGQLFKASLLTYAAEAGNGAAAASVAASAAVRATTTGPKPATSADAFDEATQSLRLGLVGRHAPFRTPFGQKPLVYSDWTATGRAVSCIERYLYNDVLPLFGNTHTTTSITGAQTTCFRHEARQIIAEAVNAKVTGRAAEDVVLFTGTGATAAVAKLVSAIGLSGPLARGSNPNDRPVVFVGPFEHHSNLLPWRESCAEVITIGEQASGGLDLGELRDQLGRFASRKLKIGSFSAASNVTGGLEDVDRVTATLHRAGALALWDYATAAPYVRMDMNPVASGTDDQALVAKDAIFFSGHKFLGGTGTPGVLVVKKSLLRNAVPGTVGGGTVFFVTQDDHRYLSNKEEREEGGTPDIMGSIRLGLVVQMKERLGGQAILEREEALAELGLNALRGHPAIVVLGDTGRKRLPIFSFLVRSSKGRYLHYNFVCALLNDLFGVQSRGGCQCAGPYSQRLLGMSPEDTRAVEAELLCKHELLRPGFSRFSLAYINSDREAKYILDAVLFVADHGSSFLPQYRVNYKTGEWKHRTRFTRFPERRWLGHCNYGFPASSASKPQGKEDALAQGWPGPGGLEAPKTTPEAREEEEAKESDMMEGVFQEALTHLSAAEAGSGEERWQGAEDMLGAEGETLRWFPYPWEGGSGNSIPVTNAARPAEASAVRPPAEGTGVPTAGIVGDHGMGPLPLRIGELSSSSSPSSSSSGRCIIKPAVYGPGVEGADAAAAAAAAALAGARTGEARTDEREGGAALRSLNGAATPANIAGAADAPSSAGGESIAAGQPARSRDGEGFPGAVAAVTETRSPGPDRSAELRGVKGEGSAGAPPETTGLAEDAGAVKMKPSLKEDYR